MTIIVVGDENCICSEHRRLQLPSSWESRTRVELPLAQEVNIWGKPSTPPPAVYHQLVHWTELLYMVCWDHVQRSAAQYNATLVELSRKWQVRYHRGRLSLCCIAQWNCFALHCRVELQIALHSGTVLHCIAQWNYTSHCIALQSGTIHRIELHCVQSMSLTIAAVRPAQLHFTLQCFAWYITSCALH